MKSQGINWWKGSLFILIVVLIIGLSACSGGDTVLVEESHQSGEINQNSNDEEGLQLDEKETNELPDFEEAIYYIIEARVKAIKEDDLDSFMEYITVNNQFLGNEQIRWFNEMTNERIRNVNMTISDIEIIDDNTGIVTINQTHETEESFDFDYPLLFRYEDGKWMDYGYAFKEYHTERFIVKYMEGETKVDMFVEILDDAYDHLDEIYDEKPYPDYELKLFYDQEMLRQRSVPTSPWLFTGWAEPDESMKIYTMQDYHYNSYAGVVQHELVHHITINMCNHNLPLWLLEGIAMFDGSAYYGHEHSKLLSSITKESVSRTIKDLEENDLSVVYERDDIYSFYGTSYMYVKYIHDVYGREKLMEIFYEAGKLPFNSSALNENHKEEVIKTGKEVLMTVLGMTKEELSEGYLEWLNGEL